MQVEMTNRSAVAIQRYLIVAFALSYIGQAVIWLTGGVDGRLFGSLAPFLMFTPAIAAAVAIRTERGRFLPLLRGRVTVRHVSIGVMVPALTALATALLLNKLYGLAPAPFEVHAGRISVPDSSRLLVEGDQSLATFAASFVGSSFWLAILGGVLAVGEEIGWRGYLQPRLSARWGQLGGMILVGTAWGYWHLPLILQGYVFPEAPVLGAVLFFPLVAIGLSLFLGWLRDACGSIWPAVLAHGSYNAAFGTTVFSMDLGAHATASYTVIVALTVLTGLASALAIRRGRARNAANGLAFAPANPVERRVHDP